jgi:hypothetical protein
MAIRNTNTYFLYQIGILYILLNISMPKIFATSPLNDTIRVNFLNKLSQKYLYTGPSVALQYAQEALDSASVLHYTEGLYIASII